MTEQEALGILGLQSWPVSRVALDDVYGKRVQKMSARLHFAPLGADRDLIISEMRQAYRAFSLLCAMLPAPPPPTPAPQPVPVPQPHPRPTPAPIPPGSNPIPQPSSTWHPLLQKGCQFVFSAAVTALRYVGRWSRSAARKLSAFLVWAMPLIDRCLSRLAYVIARGALVALKILGKVLAFFASKIMGWACKAWNGARHHPARAAWVLTASTVLLIGIISLLAPSFPSITTGLSSWTTAAIASIHFPSLRHHKASASSMFLGGATLSLSKDIDKYLEAERNDVNKNQATDTPEILSQTPRTAEDIQTEEKSAPETTLPPSPPGLAYVRVYAHPVADVYVDDYYVMQVPSPGHMTAASGRRVFKCVTKDGTVKTFSVDLLPGKKYHIKVQLETGTVDIEQVEDL